MAEIEAEEEKKSSKKLIIIAVAVVLVLAGGGAAYFFMAGDQAVEANSDSTEEAAEETAAEAFYYDMPKPFIVNYAKGSAVRLLQISISMLVPNDTVVEALKKHEPMIRNNLLMLLSAQDPGSLKSVDGKEQLREKILQEINKVMIKMAYKSQVKELFFTAFVMQ